MFISISIIQLLVVVGQNPNTDVLEQIIFKLSLPWVQSAQFQKLVIHALFKQIKALFEDFRICFFLWY